MMAMERKKSNLAQTAAPWEPAAAKGLYVHIPFCVRKCPYCDFNTFDLERAAVKRFLASLRNEIRYWQEQLGNVRFDTVFIGGGTPTVLSGSQLAEVMAFVREGFEIAPDAEITVEANPGSVTRRGLEAMAASGVNRVSMGAQAFDDALLQHIGRNHSVKDIYESYAWIREAGLANINLDLMFALPHQTMAQWEATLAAVVALNPTHISAYSLIIEEGTPFAALDRLGRLALPDEDLEAAMYETMLDKLAAAGYELYEISNFCRDGMRCRHNEIYWHNGQWLGIGPGAHSYWNGDRFWNVRQLDAYCERTSAGQSPVEGREICDRDTQMDETMMLGLRLTEGVSLMAFEKRFGVSLLDVYGEQVKRLVEGGLLRMDQQRLQLTERGRLLANRVFAAFLRDRESDR